MGKTNCVVIRYQTLDPCFRNPGRQYFMDDLLEACTDAIQDLKPGASGIKSR